MEHILEFKNANFIDMRILCGEQRAIRLLELSDAGLAAALAAGRPLVLKGADSENVVLCTADEAFLVREVHTSNHFVVLGSPDTRAATVCTKRPRSDASEELAETFYKTTNVLEAARFPGRLETLHHALSTSPKLTPVNEPGGMACADDSYQVILGAESVFQAIQAPDAAIRACLCERGAVVYNARYWLPSDELVRLFLRHVFALLADHQFDHSAVPASVARDSDHSIPETVAAQLCQLYFTKTGLDAKSVARFYALLVASTRKTWSAGTFLDAWSAALERDLAPATCDAALLRGIAVADVNGILRDMTNAMPSSPLFFPAHNGEMPWTSDPAVRLAHLFSTCGTRWELSALEPYMEPVARALAGKATVQDLALKFSRISTTTVPNGEAIRIVTPLIRLA